MFRKSLGEAIGTLLLTACVVGSGIMGERLADGNTAVALLTNTLATVAALATLITLFGPISVGLALLNGREVRIGGYGFPISDEGSGAEIGLHAIRLVLRASENPFAHKARKRK